MDKATLIKVQEILSDEDLRGIYSIETLVMALNIVVDIIINNDEPPTDFLQREIWDKLHS